MTQSDKDNANYQFRHFQQRREKYYAPKFNKAIQLQIKEAIPLIRQGQSPFISSKPILDVLKPLWIDCATTYGAKILIGIKRDQKARMPIGFSERMLMLITQYYGIDFLNMSEGITTTLREYIQKVLTESYSLGLGIDDIVKKLQDTELTRQRARLIARTETVTASNRGGLIVAKDTGLNLNKVWLAADDGRTRVYHRQVDDKKVGVDEFFHVAGYLMKVPGDRGGKDGQPKVPKDLTINCRCSAIYEKVGR